jgi:3-oxoacyl-[acyl-carrier-protein] synthase II
MPEWEAYERLNVKLGGPAVFTAPEYPRKKTRGMGRNALMAVASADRALADSGLSGSEELQGGRVGVSYGSSMGSIDALLDFTSMLMNHNVQGITATTYIRSMPQTCAVNIGVFFGLKGRLLTTNTACTAGSLAIGLGYEAIKYGHAEVMVCGGAEELNPTGSAVFDTLYATSTRNDAPQLTPRPFDRARDGLVIGEGAGSLILEELEHARARGARILAEVAGFGTNTDGDHITQPNKATMEVAMRLALDGAGIAPSDVGYINGHGTATSQGDVAESAATCALFGAGVPFSALKGYTGHTLGACGAIEAWATINMMNAGWFAPNHNLLEVDPACAGLDYIVGRGRELDVEYAVSNNFAFGGINTSIVLRRWRA